MKKIFINSMLCLFILIGFNACVSKNDPVKKANEKNEMKADKGIVVDKVADFLVKSADARMMDAQEGKLAVEKGTTAEIREYGKLMVADQAMLLAEIQKLAANRSITLPTIISEPKQNGREKLLEKQGKDFDKKFIKMITIDHKRDVKLFKQATKFNDPGVSSFAKKYLPLIQSHLDQSKAIKKRL
ncbi:MAG: DUF4142 domain-containing protein [Bacteroidota bacterium]